VDVKRLFTLLFAIVAGTLSAHAGELIELQMAEVDTPGSEPPLQPDADVIRLKAAGELRVGTAQARNALNAANATVDAAAQALGGPPEYLYYLVHLPRRAGAVEAQAVEAAGFDVVQVAHENTLVVRCPVEAVRQLATAAGADYIVAVAPEWKIAPRLQFSPLPTETLTPLDVPASRGVMATVNLFPGEPVTPILVRLAELGVGVMDSEEDRGIGAFLDCFVPEPALPPVAALPGVAWIEPTAQRECQNNVLTGQTAIGGDASPGLINVYAAWTHATRPVTGTNQIVGHIDSGIDRGGDGGTLHEGLDDRLVDSTGTGIATRTGQYYYQASYDAAYAYTSAQRRCQRFVCVGRGNIDIAVFGLYRGATALGGNMYCRIVAETGGVPGATITNGTSNAVAASVLGTSAAEITFTFATPPAVTEGTAYYYELDFSAVTGISASNAFDILVLSTQTTSTYYYSGGWVSSANNAKYYQRTTDATGDRRWSDLNGHGTHTGGTIVGTGGATGGTTYRGVAYGALLEHRAAGVNNTTSLSISNLYTQLQNAYNNGPGASTTGARIFSNSWGDSSALGDYTSDARTYDLFMWDYPQMLICNSAGNSGVDSVAPTGKIDATTVTGPGTAKNILSVGNSETYRPSGDASYGYYWTSPTTAPFYTSKCTYQQDTYASAGFGEGICPSSGRGPTDDTRIKPDLVAPGWLMSTRSAYDTNSNAYPTAGTHPGAGYVIKNGTSMACPAVAGCAALVRQSLVTYEGKAAPSAALVKALLIAGCENLSPGQYDTGSYRELYDNASNTGSPDYAQGYGRVDLARSLGMLDSLDRGWYESVNGFTNTTTARYLRLRAATATPISAVLVWTDYPGTALTSPTIVNDLDLEIRTGYTGAKNSGTLVAQALLPYNEQNGSGGGTGDDDRNTVEKCVVATPTVGTYYTFEVDCETLGQTGQQFALVITGDFDSPTPVTVIDFRGHNTAHGPELRWELAEGMDFVGCHVYRAPSPAGPFAQVNPQLLLPDAQGRYTFTDRELNLGRGKSYYRVVGVRSNGMLEEQDAPPYAISLSEPERALSASLWRN